MLRELFFDTLTSVMPISPVATSKMNSLKCSLVQCLTRNLQFIWNWLDKIGFIPLFRTAGNDLIPKSPTQALAIVVKLYVAMVISIWLYREIGQKSQAYQYFNVFQVYNAKVNFLTILQTNQAFKEKER